MMPADGVELTEGLVGGRRRLQVRLGRIAVTVTEIPAGSLSEQEHKDIALARRAYALWGDCTHAVADHLDGGAGSVYDAIHYVAWLKDGDGPGKLVVMRKVALNPAALTDGQR